jgi:ERCC4-related helicase
MGKINLRQNNICPICKSSLVEVVKGRKLRCSNNDCIYIREIMDLNDSGKRTKKRIKKVDLSHIPPIDSYGKEVGEKSKEEKVEKKKDKIAFSKKDYEKESEGSLIDERRESKSRLQSIAKIMEAYEKKKEKDQRIIIEQREDEKGEKKVCVADNQNAYYEYSVAKDLKNERDYDHDIFE